MKNRKIWIGKLLTLGNDFSVSTLDTVRANGKEGICEIEIAHARSAVTSLSGEYRGAYLRAYSRVLRKLLQTTVLLTK